MFKYIYYLSVASDFCSIVFTVIKVGWMYCKLDSYASQKFK